MNDLISRKIFSTLIDFFWGDGFDNWCRVRYINGRWVVQKANKTPPKELMDHIRNLAKEK